MLTDHATIRHTVNFRLAPEADAAVSVELDYRRADATST